MKPDSTCFNNRPVHQIPLKCAEDQIDHFLSQHLGNEPEHSFGIDILERAEKWFWNIFFSASVIQLFHVSCLCSLVPQFGVCMWFTVLFCFVFRNIMWSSNPGIHPSQHVISSLFFLQSITFDVKVTCFCQHSCCCGFVLIAKPTVKLFVIKCMNFSYKQEATL